MHGQNHIKFAQFSLGCIGPLTHNPQIFLKSIDGCEISSFRRGENETVALLHCYAQ